MALHVHRAGAVLGDDAGAGAGHQPRLPCRADVVRHGGRPRRRLPRRGRLHRCRSRQVRLQRHPTVRGQPAVSATASGMSGPGTPAGPASAPGSGGEPPPRQESSRRPSCSVPGEAVPTAAGASHRALRPWIRLPRLLAGGPSGFVLGSQSFVPICPIRRAGCPPTPSHLLRTLRSRRSVGHFCSTRRRQTPMTNRADRPRVGQAGQSRGGNTGGAVAAGDI